MKRNQILLLGFGVAVLVFLFYWIEIRPENIRKNCAEVATIKASGSSLESLKTAAERAQEPALTSNYYTECLRFSGLAN
jgi:type II secretory pathway component PulM